MRCRPADLALALALIVTGAGPRAAQGAADDDFYKGRDITLYVGSPAGGPYDAYARLIGRYLGRHVPGSPSVVVQNMPGASGRRLMSFMGNLAPRDGTAIAAPQRAVAFDPLLGVASRFDANALGWIGSANAETNVCIAWHTSPIRTIEDVRTRPMTVGTSGPSSTDAIYPNLMDNLFGMKFKVIGGYQGAPETHLAMERGEVDGRCGISWDTLNSLNADWLRDKKVRLLVQIGLDRVPDLADVPWVFDMVGNEEQRQIFAFWTAPNKMGRPFLAPPGLPPARLELLRRAFDATLTDPQLRSEAAATSLALTSLTGDAVQALVKRIYATPSDVVAKAASAAKGN
jgi:tripartite-type tricarboxylate transporter receptor subunit TctC